MLDDEDEKRLKFLADAEEMQNRKAAEDEVNKTGGLAKPAPGHQKPGTVFYEFRRIKVNAIGIYANVLLPWFIFVIAFMVTGFQLMHKSPKMAWSIIALLFFIWVYIALKAWNSSFRLRRLLPCFPSWDEPDPMWWTYAAIAYLIALLTGTLLGYQSYSMYMKPYFSVMSMQVAGLSGGGLGGSLGSGGVDLTSASSESFMDAGIVKFAPGTELLSHYSYHFKYQTTYCVAPLGGPGGAVPRRTYDIWVVGKDCCSVSSSDYRCGSWDSPDISSTLAVRVTNDADLQNYFLAAQQAASVFKFKVHAPVFFFQTANLLETITGRKTKSGKGGGRGSGGGNTGNAGSGGSGANQDTDSMIGVQGGGGIAGFGSPLDGLKQEAYNNFCVWAAIAFIFSLFGTSMAVVKFSFLGRGKWGLWGTEESLIHGTHQNMMNHGARHM